MNRRMMTCECGSPEPWSLRGQSDVWGGEGEAEVLKDHRLVPRGCSRSVLQVALDLLHNKKEVAS